MLNLASETSAEWIAHALANLDDILVDHAHCEKKAAGGALRLLFRYPQHGFLQQPLSQLAREELEHFELVLRTLAARSTPFGRQRPSAYGGKLHALVRQGEPDRLVDLLLVAALIEARSCERFKLLAGALPEPKLAALYDELLASEARHHQTYVDLACRLEPPSRVRERLAVLARHEAEILAAPVERIRLARLHA